MALIRSYRQATGEHPDRLVCSYAMRREILTAFSENILDAMLKAELYDAMITTLCGLQVVPKSDAHPGLIMVCRAADEGNYATYTVPINAWWNVNNA